MAVDVSATLGDLVAEDQRRARVMEKFGLDYCCNGHRSLGNALADAGLTFEQVVADLDLPQTEMAAPALPRANAQLAHDIVDTHHAYMWEEMPRLRALVVKVHGVHGDRHPELETVRTAFEQAVEALEPHMTTEERIVFPAISRLEKQQPARPGAESLATQLEQLRAEHQIVGDLFKRIRQATADFQVPQDACASYRAMLTGIEEMELDLHEHIHLENNVLFPQVVILENESSR